METDPSQTVRGMAEELGVSSHAVFDGLKRIGNVKKLEKWMSHGLNDRQKLSRFDGFDVCSSLFLCNQNANFSDRIITCNEKWIRYNNRRLSRSWLHTDEPPDTSQSQKPTKSRPWLLYGVAGVIHYNFLQLVQAITAESYCEEIDEMYRKLHQQ